jgi:PBP1b-binding outer membrane lipoprotein LpoB
MKKYIVTALIIAIALSGCTKFRSKSIDTGNNTYENNTNTNASPKPTSAASPAATVSPKPMSTATPVATITPKPTSTISPTVTPEEKAIEIVVNQLAAKKIEDNKYSTKLYGNIFIKKEGVDDKGRFIIAVRNDKTEIISWYFVDANSGKFEVEQ